MKQTQQHGFGLPIDFYVIHYTVHYDASPFDTSGVSAQGTQCVSKGAARERVRGMVDHGDFIEIYCDSPSSLDPGVVGWAPPTMSGTARPTASPTSYW